MRRKHCEQPKEMDAGMPFFIYLIISAVIGIVLGLLYNMLLSKKFSGGKRTAFCVLTMIFFISGAVSVTAVIGMQSYANSKIRAYSANVELYIFDTFSDNEFVQDGFDATQITDGVLQISDIISNLTSIIPSPEELNVNKKVYDMLVGYLTNELQTQLNAVTNTIDAHVAKSNAIADENGIITVSSILSFLSGMAINQVNIVSFQLIIISMTPLAIYIIVTLIIVLIKIVSDRRKKTTVTE
jgi:hypothetical protein